ncbi:MAG: DUF1501 domain-containing protein [Candidatus Solibacter usitatus]|nr:DUF1501 domain-containing protein [Candidatus Solibacter usitatus]
MLDIQGRRIGPSHDAEGRRDFLRVGAASLLGLNLAEWFQLQAAGVAKEAKAKCVIQLWMAGGPTQTDTFDPKPEAGEDFSGPLRRPAATKVAGMRVSELLPLLAKQADKYTIIRSMTHMNNAHETAAYIMQTGTLPSAELVYPGIGAIVALKKNEAGYKGSLPPYITLTNPLGRFSEAGFLGNNYKTFAPGGDPNAKEFRVQGIVPPRGMTADRFAARRSLLKSIDTLAAGLDAGEMPAPFHAMDEFQEKAYNLILGDARKAFDLSEEKDELRNRYGRNHFGQSCLLARRLAERGVPFITINDGGWDTHKQNFDAMRRKLPILDGGFATLLEDLAQRGLLDGTIVTWYGEFGRAPRVSLEPPWFGGRHHWGNCFSAVVAGGGFQGGHVLGATDNRGENVRDRPVYPWDLTASIYQLMGIDPQGRLPHPQGCTAYVSPIASGAIASGGLLKEIL